ncbi:hypothetical protein Tco_0288677, partial [Tanacetum coccineum]
FSLFRKLLCKTFTYQNSLYETFKPPSKAYLDQLERAKEVRKTMWRKTSKSLDSGFELTAFSDADHAGCLDTRNSTSGGIQFLGD